jgi:DNA-binding NtrC family response regulator
VPDMILICDDDADIRGAMRRTLRGYNVVETASPREAMQVMKTKTFDAIVSDFSLDAESDGLDLLQLVHIQYPDMIRFLVTANRDLDVAVRAVNEGAVHRFFLKPWNDDKLRAALDIVLRSRSRSTSES